MIRILIVLWVAFGMAGCMSMTNNYDLSNSIMISSGNQDKPVDAGISTTGKDVGDAIKAAGWGGPGLPSIDEVRSLLDRIQSRNKADTP
jgi:hypothetical protein